MDVTGAQGPTLGVHRPDHNPYQQIAVGGFENHYAVAVQRSCLLPRKKLDLAIGCELSQVRCSSRQRERRNLRSGEVNRSAPVLELDRRFGHRCPGSGSQQGRQREQGNLERSGTEETVHRNTSFQMGLSEIGRGVIVRGLGNDCQMSPASLMPVNTLLAIVLKLASALPICPLPSWS